MNYAFWIPVIVIAIIGFLAYRSNKRAQQNVGKNSSVKLIHLTDESFKEIIREGVVLVDFWAPWCSPCRTMDPIINEIADEFGHQASVCKINLDDHKQSARDMKIKNIPNIIIFKDGEPRKQIIGAKPKFRITNALKDVLEMA